MKQVEITCNPNYAKMYAVMVKCRGFWQQVGPRYTYKRNAEKAAARLEQQ